MMLYTIKNNGSSYQTPSTKEAEEMSNKGAKVTSSHHVKTVQQTPTDKGTLMLDKEAEWSDPDIMAGANAWVFVGKKL